MNADTPSLINRQRPLTFTFQGRAYTGYEGDTIASALYRAGVRIFSRSFKYHRPRGLMTVDGASPNDMVTVDGVPNVHAATTPLKNGLDVRGQNAWPSLKFDLMRLTEVISPLLPVGFYYKTFIRPQVLWPLYENVIRRVAGLGEIDPRPERFDPTYYDQSHAHAELTVVGGGPAGMSAALAAAQAGAQVTLIDQNQTLGGHLRYRVQPLPKSAIQEFSPPGSRQQRGFQLARAMAEEVHAQKNITVMGETTAFGGYAENMLGLVQGRRLIKLRTDHLIVATGRIAQPRVFENNDLPGIFLGDGVRRLLHLYDVKPGNRAAVVTAGDQGWEIAQELLDAGVEIRAVIDRREPLPQGTAVPDLQGTGTSIRTGWTVERAAGTKQITGVYIDKGKGMNSEPVHIPCDTLIIAGGYAANNELLYQSGVEIEYDPRVDDFVPQRTPEGVGGAGHAAGIRGLEAVLLEGKVQGWRGAARLGRFENIQEIDQAEQQLSSLRKKTPQTPPEPAFSHDGSGKKRFVCFCEDVTQQDVIHAVNEGFDDIQTLKRYSTISMGPTQGKICSANTIKMLAEMTDRTVAETGTTTSRPPTQPVKLGLLAGRKLEPIRRTPMHHLHHTSGCTMMNAGLWKRAEHYGDITGEITAVRERVGLIDVSTLGKIEVHGPQALDLLERIYTNSYTSLDHGQLRYGMMCNEAGIIFDDGVVGCVDEDRYYLTTTSGGAERVYEWLTWWAAVWNLDVHITDQTAAYAAVNLAGPQARETLAPLTSLDLSNAAFPYMNTRQGDVAGVPARMMRIGFVGELGYEIHYPAYYGAQLWQTLMDAGAEFNISPFGIEAQRVLRLEKKHIIIGQDTNALSDPYGANMSWIVDLGKDTFIGKPSLKRQKEAPPREKLVGFRMLDPSCVPGEGDQMIQVNGPTRKHPLEGRVTSARYSPTLGESIGLAWVIPGKSAPGTMVHVRVDGRPRPAEIVHRPFYDPEGERVRM